MTGKSLRTIGMCVLAASAVSCGPKTRYVPPAPEPPAAYKEEAPLKVTQPADQVVRGAWWEVFRDPQLNALEQRVAVSNENLKTAQAQFDQARAVLSVSQSALSPQVGLNPAMARFNQSDNRLPPPYPVPYGDIQLPASVSYEIDVWGRVRGTVNATRTAAQASAADLEIVNLSVHAELAADYFLLRTRVAERALLDSAVDAFERALELTQNRFRGGVASQADVALAETQLETTRAQAVDVDVQRTALEHAIAVLVGQNPSTFTLDVTALAEEPPDIPPGLPSELLERRPDVAASERRIASASAQVGVTKAAFYPVFGLSGATGFESSTLVSLLSSVSNFWSTGALALTTVFDAGRRRAITEQAQAAYMQSVSLYELSVLNAFREVEDNLAALRVLRDESEIQARAVESAERAVALATNRYRGGVTSYLEVLTAQNAALTNQRVAANILGRRLTATVLLIKALGGGWQSTSLPQLVAGGAPPD